MIGVRSIQVFWDFWNFSFAKPLNGTKKGQETVAKAKQSR